MDVSIIIPVANKIELTRECVASIFQNTGLNIEFEIIIINDCSTDGTTEYLDRLPSPVRVLHNTDRRGFAFNNNLGAKHSAGEYLCFLNNDTVVTPGWLEPMLEMARDSNIAVIGNKHLFPDSGKIHHVGMVFDEDLKPQHIYPHLDPRLPFVNRSREFQIVTAACWLANKETFLELDGFDEAYRNGYEDCDFCLRARKRGYRVWYCAESVIYHHGQASPQRQKHDVENEKLFLNRWASEIQSDIDQYYLDDGVRHLSLVSSKGGPKCPPVAPDIHFAIDMSRGNAFAWAVGQLALALEDMGATVSIQESAVSESIEEGERERLERMTRRSPSKGAHVKWTHYWEPYLNQQCSGEVNAEIFATNYRYREPSEKQLDFWTRHLKYNQLYKLPISNFCGKALEDVGIAADRYQILPLAFSPEILDIREAEPRWTQTGFVFLAVTNSHDPYRYGTDRLLEAYADSFGDDDDVTLLLHDYGVGADSSLVERWLDEGKNSARVVWRRDLLSKRDLIRLYRSAHCFVAPFRGEGFGMKIADAFACGLPVVMTNFGGPLQFALEGTFWPVSYRESTVTDCLDAQQQMLPPFAHWADPDPIDLGQQMRRVFEQQEVAEARAARGRDHVIENFSWRSSAAKLLGAIDRWHAPRMRRRLRRTRVEEPRRDISVIIPTYERLDILKKTLEAYRSQTLPKERWELILVDDSSPTEQRKGLADFEASLPISFYRLAENSGPGPARNLGLARSNGKVVLITGDDMVPREDLLQSHLRLHEQYPEPHVAVLGQIEWHPELEATGVMRYVTEKSGLQFDLPSGREGQEIGFERFYTSNVSVKRDWLMVEDPVFEPAFFMAAYEDVELGFRLARRGLRLLYSPSATVFHLHPTTRESFFRRQYSVGKMLVVLTLMHPWLVPEEHRVFLRELEVYARRLKPHMGKGATESLERLANHLGPTWDALASLLESVPESYVPSRYQDSQLSPTEKLLKLNREASLDASYERLFDMALRAGMAEQWTGTKEGEGFVALALAMTRWNLLGTWQAPSEIPETDRRKHSVKKRLWSRAYNVRHESRLKHVANRFAEHAAYQKLKRWFFSRLAE